MITNDTIKELAKQAFGERDETKASEVKEWAKSKGLFNPTTDPIGPVSDVGAVDELHPTGRCSCGGEGRCDWCIALEDRIAAMTPEERAFMDRGEDALFEIIAALQAEMATEKAARETAEERVEMLEMFIEEARRDGGWGQIRFDQATAILSNRAKP